MSDADLRALRAAVYGECSDMNWEAVREVWRSPENIEWLRGRAAHPLSV